MRGGIIMSHDNYDNEDEDNKEEEEEDKNKKKDDIVWVKKPNWKDLLGTEFGEDVNLPDLEEIIKHIMSNIDFYKNSSDGPVIWGFSINMTPGKNHEIRQFGKFNPRRRNKVVEENTEQLVDIIQRKEEITVITEIMDVKESDINIKATETELKILVDTSEQKFYREITLPCKVLPDSAKKHYKNGILEIKLVCKKTQ